MPQAKKELQELEDVFNALGHATRRTVLSILHFRGGSMTAGEISERFSCSWPTTTRHLNVLTDSGLISVEQRGRERLYRLNYEKLLAVIPGWLRTFETKHQD